jgi:hypothetical protein
MHPTIAPKSKASVKDVGIFQAKALGVTDGAGVLVTGDDSIKQGDGLTGDEYIAVAYGTFVALGVDFAFNLVFDVKNGNGNKTIDASTLFGLIPGGIHRAAEMSAVDVWGPIGDQVCDAGGTNTCQGGTACTTNADCPTLADCETNLVNGFVLAGLPNPCIGGEKLGVAGILIP